MPFYYMTETEFQQGGAGDNKQNFAENNQADSFGRHGAKPGDVSSGKNAYKQCRGKGY